MTTSIGSILSKARTAMSANQAAARLVSTADEMMQTILDMKR
ncbi:MAG TPA: hypothetical protein VMM79_02245 [Longimicrobiales bacterium]|nr:hypothetical protein [Longimicrobiales bacterium]